MSLSQGTLRKVPLFRCVGSVVLAAGAGSAAGMEGRLLPGSAWLLAGGQKGWRGCCLLLGFALAPQLRSPLLPACTDEHPPYGRLSPERGRCWLTTWEASKEFRDSLKSFRDSKGLSQTCGVGDGAQPGLLSVLGTHRRAISSALWHGGACSGHHGSRPLQSEWGLSNVGHGIPPWGTPMELGARGKETLAAATALLLNTWERIRTICHRALQSKGQRCVGRREQLSADGFVMRCSASPQITDAGSLTFKLERPLMQHICCRETLVYREQSYRVANVSVCLLVLKVSSCLKWWVVLGKKK